MRPSKLTVIATCIYCMGVGGSSLAEQADRILKGQTQGRVVVDISA